MATDAYEAAIKGLKDLLRYDNIVSASKDNHYIKVSAYIFTFNDHHFSFVLPLFMNHHHFLISALYYFALTEIWD